MDAQRVRMSTMGAFRLAKSSTIVNRSSEYHQISLDMLSPYNSALTVPVRLCRSMCCRDVPDEAGLGGKRLQRGGNRADSSRQIAYQYFAAADMADAGNELPTLDCTTTKRAVHMHRSRDEVVVAIGDSDIGTGAVDRIRSIGNG